ncbi:hypothetical protein P692DRAFT_201899805 [Suillus brevipes Sb2]|nr:hypothetical protein P692DRAFT_201899805 [Suillus brevipes Sb2]
MIGCILWCVLSILIMIQVTTSVVYFGVDTMLLYFCMELGFTLIYTIPVTSRLLVMRCQMKQAAVAQHNPSAYDTVVIMLIESATLYSVVCVILIVSIVSDCDSLSNP